MNSNPDNIVNKKSWPGLFRQSFDRALTQQNITSGFRATGIYPLDRSVIPADALAPSKVFESATSTHQGASVSKSISSTVTSEPESISSLTTSTDDSTPSTSFQIPSIYDPSVSATSQISFSAESTVAPSPIPSALTTSSVVSNFQQPDNIISLETNQPVDMRTSSFVSELAVAPSSSRDPDPFLPITPVADSDDQVFNLSETVSASQILSDLANGGVNVELITPECDVNNEFSDLWNNQLSTLFDVPSPEQKTRPESQSKRKLTSHRLLTSDEILQEKKRKAEEKKEQELKKEMRKLKKEKAPKKSVKK
ncbi:uncharacterized protein LOC134231371 [Saccostrea cucullata]|uniref:uncharacterized protein LOC134231371 n=1 Tax=Saccostrea cuccullata TaxID=36930 RepID=UPI002ED15242